MKKVLKEGGKRGVEIEGAADMGGLKYFCTKMLEPAGDLDMLVGFLPGVAKWFLSAATDNGI